MMINTAVETQGTTPLANYQKLAPVTDTFLFDIKQINSEHHKAMLGIGNEGIRRNLEWLVDSGANVIVRMPLIRGYNDSFDAITGAIDYVQKLAKRGNIRRIDMLPYHQLGRKSTNAWICPTRLPRTCLIHRTNWTGWKPSSGNLILIFA